MFVMAVYACSDDQWMESGVVGGEGNPAREGAKRLRNHCQS